MHEGPGTIVYLPTEHGMRVGEALGKITKDLPLDARNNLADVISMDPEKATKALHRYDNVVSEAQKLLGKLPAKDMSAEEIAQTLHRANEIADKTMPVVNALRPAWDFVQENPVATAATLGGGTGFLAGRLHDKTAAPTEDYPLVNAFQRGFENAVQK
jgi:hypothetical protein